MPEPKDVKVINVVKVEGNVWDSGMFTVPGIASGSAYATGGMMGSIFVLEGLPNGGIIQTVSVSDRDAEEIAFDIMMFSGPPIVVADNAAADMVDSDDFAFVGRIAITNADFGVLNDNSVASANPQQAYRCVNHQLYCFLVTRGAPNYTASTDLRLRFFILS